MNTNPPLDPFEEEILRRTRDERYTGPSKDGDSLPARHFPKTKRSGKPLPHDSSDALEEMGFRMD